jgi:hypothetical protein
MSKKYNWRSVLYISTVLFICAFITAKSYVNKNFNSQDALTISPNLAQSSALVGAKTLQIATDNLVNMKSTSSHYKTTLQKVVFIKKCNDNMLYPVVKTYNTISIHLFP